MHDGDDNDDGGDPCKWEDDSSEQTDEGSNQDPPRQHAELTQAQAQALVEVGIPVVGPVDGGASKLLTAYPITEYEAQLVAKALPGVTFVKNYDNEGWWIDEVPSKPLTMRDPRVWPFTSLNTLRAIKDFFVEYYKHKSEKTREITILAYENRKGNTMYRVTMGKNMFWLSSLPDKDWFETVLQGVR